MAAELAGGVAATAVEIEVRDGLTWSRRSCSRHATVGGAATASDELEAAVGGAAGLRRRCGERQVAGTTPSGPVKRCGAQRFIRGRKIRRTRNGGGVVRREALRGGAASGRDRRPTGRA